MSTPHVSSFDPVAARGAAVTRFWQSVGATAVAVAGVALRLTVLRARSSDIIVAMFLLILTLAVAAYATYSTVRCRRELRGIGAVGDIVRTRGTGEALERLRREDGTRGLKDAPDFFVAVAGQRFLALNRAGSRLDISFEHVTLMEIYVHDELPWQSVLRVDVSPLARLGFWSDEAEPRDRTLVFIVGRRATVRLRDLLAATPLQLVVDRAEAGAP